MSRRSSAVCPQTTTWICDSCHQAIANASCGWVEWVSNLDATNFRMISRGLRIVHHDSHSQRQSGCRYRSQNVGDAELNAFLGPDGLMDLLEMLAEGEFPSSEVLELIKRIHIPGYEHARLSFSEAIDREVITPRSLANYYHQEELLKVLRMSGGGAAT